MGSNVPPDARPNRREPLRVSLLVFPEAGLGTLTGMFDTLSSFPLLSTFDGALPPDAPFAVELVAATDGSVSTASGVPLPVHRSISDPERTDIAIVPSLLVAGGTWKRGRYPDLVAWLRRVHEEGALVCSACSGVLLISRDRPALRPRCDDPSGLRRHVPEQLPRRSAPPRRDARRDRGA